MEFNERINQLKERAAALSENLNTEEATKNALIMPFINALGYDVFNPLEVVPEFIADVGVKKGEKVDYAIIQDGKPIILIECKKIEDSKLDVKKHATQLYRYFTATEARFIILTNGISYKFFSDVDESGKLDNEPFFTFNLVNFKEAQLLKLQGFCKEAFDVQKAFSNASDMKYISQFVDALTEEYLNPSTEFIKYLINKSGIYDGRITPQLVEKHRKTTIEAFNSFMSKTMKNVLEGGLSLNSTQEQDVNVDKKSTIETTLEELEGYTVVKSLLKEVVDINRVTYRDNSSYFNILLDDNIRKTICRLHFNTSQKYITIIGDDGDTKHPIDNLNSVFQYENELKSRVSAIDEQFKKSTK